MPCGQIFSNKSIQIASDTQNQPIAKNISKNVDSTQSIPCFDTDFSKDLQLPIYLVPNEKCTNDSGFAGSAQDSFSMLDSLD